VRRASLIGTLVAIAAIALAACGSSGPSTEDEARAAAVRAVEAEDPHAFCRRLVSERFLDEMVGDDVAACQESTLVEKHPGDATATAVALRGEDESRAEVLVKVEGGKLGGSSGHLEMVREDNRWLLDRYADDYVRSHFLANIEEVEKGAIAIPRMKACLGSQVARLPSDRVRQISNDASTDSAAMIEDLVPLAEHCPKAMAEYGASAITDALTKSGQRSPAFIRCIRDQLEASFSITDIAPELIGPHPDFGAVLALEGIAAGAKQNCAGR
jgi:hypothetical protein